MADMTTREVRDELARRGERLARHTFHKFLETWPDLRPARRIGPSYLWSRSEFDRVCRAITTRNKRPGPRPVT